MKCDLLCATLRYCASNLLYKKRLPRRSESRGNLLSEAGYAVVLRPLEMPLVLHSRIGPGVLIEEAFTLSDKSKYDPLRRDRVQPPIANSAQEPVRALTFFELYAHGLHPS